MAELPAELREALDARGFGGIPSWGPSETLKRDRARAMAAALRWADATLQKAFPSRAIMRETIAALEQESADRGRHPHEF